VECFAHRPATNAGRSTTAYLDEDDRSTSQNIHSERTTQRGKRGCYATYAVETTRTTRENGAVATLEKFPLSDSARGNFFRIINSTVSHFFDLSVAAAVFLPRSLIFLKCAPDFPRSRVDA
jgi:hypothetical protein